MSQSPDLRHTPLYDLHVAAGARMVDFGGWEMPVQYSGILLEHSRVRDAAGAFDVSHMGRVVVSGADAAMLLQHAATNDVSRLVEGQAQYSLICNPDGGVKDDVLLFRLAGAEYLAVVNASNREKVLSWLGDLRRSLASSLGRSLDVTIADTTFETVMIGIQGPKAMDLLQPVVPEPINGLRYYWALRATVFGGQALIARTGYTGEDGFELVMDIDSGRQLWQHLMSLAAGGGLALAGLGARDTLRLEAGMPLYGHELDETINPIEAGLSRVVRLEKGGFVGREALAAIVASGPARQLAGLIVEDGAIARQGTPVAAEGRDIGVVTSGSLGPTVGASIAMAFLEPGTSPEGHLQVVVRGRPHPCRVVSLPFLPRRKRA